METKTTMKVMNELLVVAFIVIIFSMVAQAQLTRTISPLVKPVEVSQPKEPVQPAFPSKEQTVTINRVQAPLTISKVQPQIPIQPQPRRFDSPLSNPLPSREATTAVQDRTITRQRTIFGEEKKPMIQQSGILASNRAQTTQKPADSTSQPLGRRPLPEGIVTQPGKLAELKGAVIDRNQGSGQEVQGPTSVAKPVREKVVDVVRKPDESSKIDRSTIKDAPSSGDRPLKDAIQSGLRDQQTRGQEGGHLNEGIPDGVKETSRDKISPKDTIYDSLKDGGRDKASSKDGVSDSLKDAVSDRRDSKEVVPDSLKDAMRDNIASKEETASQGGRTRPDEKPGDRPAKEDRLPKEGTPQRKDTARLPHKERLAKDILGVKEAVRKKTPREEPAPPESKRIKEKDLDRLKVPKEKREKAADLHKKSDELKKKGKSDEAKKLKDEADSLLPKIKVKQEKQVTKQAKEFKDQRPSLVNKTKGRLNPDVRIEKRSYSLEYENSSIDKTDFTYIVEPPKGGLTAFELVVDIPKDVANHIDSIEFQVPPDEIIEVDPVVKWALKNVPQGTQAEYSFTVDGDVQNFDTLALAAGEKPSVVQRMVFWILDLFGIFD